MRAFLVLIAFLATGCVTGSSYPKQYANTYCSSLYMCVAEDSIEFWGGWDDENECIEDTESAVTGSPDYEAYEEGDATFDEDAALDCLNEIEEIKTDSDCRDSDGDPNMGILDFTVDAATDACGKVYPAE